MALELVDYIDPFPMATGLGPAIGRIEIKQFYNPLTDEYQDGRPIVEPGDTLGIRVYVWNLTPDPRPMWMARAVRDPLGVLHKWPLVGETIVTGGPGTLQEYIVAIGDHVAVGDVLAIVDGAQVTSPVDGIVAMLLQNPGVVFVTSNIGLVQIDGSSSPWMVPGENCASVITSFFDVTDISHGDGNYTTELYAFMDGTLVDSVVGTVIARIGEEEGLADWLKDNWYFAAGGAAALGLLLLWPRGPRAPIIIMPPT